MVNTLHQEYISFSTKNEICPFFIEISHDGIIISLGVTIQKLLPKVKLPVSFEHLFTAVMPAVKSTSFQQQEKKLYIIKINNSGITLKMYPIQLDSGNTFLVGHPVINESFSFEKYGLTITDLPKHDASIEYLFLHQAMRKSMLEADVYNQQLHKTNLELKAMIKELEFEHEKERFRNEMIAYIFHSKSPDEISNFITLKCSSFLGLNDASTFVYDWQTPEDDANLSMVQNGVSLTGKKVSIPTVVDYPFHRCNADEGSQNNCGSCPQKQHMTYVPLTTGNGTVEGCIYLPTDQLDEKDRWKVVFVEDIAKIAAVRISELKAEYNLKSLNERLETEVENKTKELKENIRNLEMFAYSVSHDLKAPLRHIYSFAELLKNKISNQIDESSKKYLQTLIDSSNKMSNLIDALLHFSRVGTVALNKSLIKPSDIIDEIISHKKIQYPHLKIVVKTSVPKQIFADRILIYQVFENLISNAIKYSSKNDTVLINISSKIENGLIEFCIKDNGVGFNMSFMKKLFTPFQRLHSSEDFEGTGIGLANVRRIVERHGGNVTAESEPGKGSTFMFSIPQLNLPSC